MFSRVTLCVQKQSNIQLYYLQKGRGMKELIVRGHTGVYWTYGRPGQMLSSPVSLFLRALSVSCSVHIRAQANHNQSSTEKINKQPTNIHQEW